MAILTQITAMYLGKKRTITLCFEKNANFYVRKLAKIGENRRK
jgi:hypothetical protein